MDDDAAEPAEKEYKQARIQALIDGKETCVFCRHTQPGSMQVHHMNCNHGDNTHDNLRVSCFICHANHHLWLAGKSISGEGVNGAQLGSYLIYLPGVEQGLLNRFLMSCFVAKQSKNKEIKQKAVHALGQLELLQKPVIDVFGLSSTQSFGGVLADLPETAYEYRAEIMTGLKMVMTEDSFMFDSNSINDLSQIWLKIMPEQTWEGVRSRMFAQLDENKKEE